MHRSGSILQVGLNGIKRASSKRMLHNLSSSIARSSSYSPASVGQNAGDGWLSKVKNAGRGSKVGIGFTEKKSKSLSSTPLGNASSTWEDTRNDSMPEKILARLQKDNKRLLKDLEQAEARAKEAEELMVLCDDVKEKLNLLKQKRVSNEQYRLVSKMVKDEKAATAGLECEKEGLETELTKVQKKQRKGKLFKK